MRMFVLQMMLWPFLKFPCNAESIERNSESKELAIVFDHCLTMYYFFFSDGKRILLSIQES